MQVQKVRVLAASVRKFLHRNAEGRIANLLANVRPADIANLLTELTDREQVAIVPILLRNRGNETVAETLSDLEVEVAAYILQQLSSPEISGILQESESDDAANFIAALPEELADQVLRLMGAKESKEVRGLLEHEKDTAGRIMTPNVFALNESLSVSEAIQTIQTGTDLEMVFYLYVIDDRGHLVGVVSLRQLLMVPPSTPLKKVMTTDVISVKTETDQEEVARQVALYDLLALPVVDHENKLVGMVTVDDVIDVIQEEAAEDILHLAGVDTDDRVFASRWQSFKKRIPWLAVHLGTALIAANVVAYYEPLIGRFSFLAIFLPIVAGMGGSAGIQTLTITVRGLALGDVSWANSRTVIGKELLLGLANGLVIGTLAGVVAYLWIGRPELGLILGFAMVINMFVAGFLGTSIPLLLRKLKVDPAIASSMLLTAVTDALGFFSFLALSFRFLVT